MSKDWEREAIALLEASLFPVPHEKNELDWKESLSPNSEKLAQHICAFANLNRGGYLVFGVSNVGTPLGVDAQQTGEIVRKLGNIAREGVTPSVFLDHAILNFNDKSLLFVHIPQAAERPVYLRGKTIYDSFTRSAGQTRKMSRHEVGRLIAQSSPGSFETEIAQENLSSDDISRLLDIQSYFELNKRALPQTTEATLEALIQDKLIKRENTSWQITNLGAILFAKDLHQIDHLKRKAIRVIVYGANDRLNTIREHEDRKGYASGFENLVAFINSQLPANEVIEQALRKEVKMYPELAIRELVANALIHQDFYEIGTGSMIEIFTDRVEITNPGRPMINTLRFIDHPPQSRNEMLASLMRRMNICEERGTGIDKVIFQVELYQLPPPDFIETDNHLKVILYAQRPLTKMEKKDRVRACYQHCSLKYVSGSKMSNQTLRERFKILDRNHPIASRIIADTLQAELIKLSDPDSKSRKFATYVPFWA